jgi:acetyl-CoA carboxylase carboxyl transferase subunit beta
MARGPDGGGEGGHHPARRGGSGWLSKLRPGVRKPEEPRASEGPDDLWVKCPDTGELIFRPDLEAALFVTPSGFHMRITPEQRFRFTFDAGRFERLPAPRAVEDPLGFVDQKPYVQRLAAAREATGDQDAVSIAVGAVGGVASVLMVQNFAFLGGSLGMSAGDGFIAAARAALARRAPLVAVTASGGARMQEGALSLMQMARTTLAIEELKGEGLPYVVVLTDPTTGGVTASYAMLGDVHLAEPGALIGFTGPRIIEQTIRETLPPGFQRSEYLEAKGMVDQVTPRAEIPKVLGRLLRALTASGPRRAKDAAPAS